MKKTVILLLLAASLLPMTLSAQKKSPVKMGIRIAPGIGWIGMDTEGYENDGVGGSFAAGLVTDIYFTKNYAFCTGVNFNFLNAKQTYRDTYTIDQEPVPGVYHRKYSYTYIELPLMIKMKTNPFGDFSFFAQVGVGNGINIRSRVHDEFTSDDGEQVKDESSYNNETVLFREAVLVGIGAEYALDESSRIVVGLNYSNGLNNMFKGANQISHEDLKGRLNYAELNIAFLF